MTAQEFKDRLLKAAENLRTENTPFKLAVYSTVAEQAKRIFTDGQSTDGRTHQYNKTTPLYLNPATTFNGGKIGQPVGKNGEKIFKSGKKKGEAHKTVYFESYYDYRGKIGRENSFVNWELSGDLKLDFENPQGGTPTPIKVSENEYVSGLRRQDNIKKREGLEEKYGKIFFLTDSEKKTFYETVRFELRKLLRS